DNESRRGGVTVLATKKRGREKGGWIWGGEGAGANFGAGGLETPAGGGGGGAKCFLDARIRREQKNATRVYIPTISDARRCLTESIDGLIAAAAITLNDEWRCAGPLAGLGQWPPRSSGGSRPKG